MVESDVTRASDAAVAPFAFDFGSEFVKEKLPAEMRTELAVVAQRRRLDLADDVAQRTVRLQASCADMDQTIRRAGELSRTNGAFTIRSSHRTASGETEIVVQRQSPIVYAILALVGVILLMWILR